MDKDDCTFFTMSTFFSMSVKRLSDNDPTLTINEMRRYTSTIEEKERANLKGKRLGSLYLAIEAAYISGSNKK